MCGRYQLTLPLEEFEDAFAIKGPRQWIVRYNIAPAQEIPIIRSETGEAYFDWGRWGFIPHWAADGLNSKPHINARGETAAHKASFKEALHRGRCLIPATGFYEWKRQHRARIPHLIRLKKTRAFAMAGISQTWRHNQSIIRTIAILTVNPKGALGELHDRMPVIINPQDYGTWLNSQTTRFDIEALFKPLGSDELSIQQVSERVNQVRYDGPECEAAPTGQISLF